jgi:phospholipase C
MLSARWTSTLAFALWVVLGCRPKVSTPTPTVDAGHVATDRSDCDFGPGDLPSQTLADFKWIGAALPLDHIVFVMQENRSFDHYFSSLVVPGQVVDGASPAATNPDPLHPGQTVSRFHQTEMCFANPAEEWNNIHLDLDDGGLDGFTTQNADADDPQGLRAMGYYDGSDLPFYYSLASAFTISDRHFASALTNTFPNRLFFMAGTAFGLTGDGSLPPSANSAGVPYPNVFTRLNDAQVSWSFYSQSTFSSACLLLDTCEANSSHLFSLEQFFTDAAAGQLPAVSWVEGDDLTGGGLRTNEDPPADPQVGEALVERIARAVMASPNWPTSALLITWDEPGGLYEHVVPPAACIPDSLPPRIPTDGGVQAQFDQLGLRVGLIAVSPFAKRGYVSHQVTDHTSLLRLVEARFNLPALTRRDANAVPPFDMFDFSAAQLSLPDLVPATIEDAGATKCAAMYPP